MWRRAATLATLLVLLASVRPTYADSGAEKTTTASCTPNCYIGLDGSLRDSDLHYGRLVARGRPHYLRASIEIALALGFATAVYWVDPKMDVADWDVPSIERRLSAEGWRLDNNLFNINFLGHAANGLGFHILGRSNDLSLAASVGVGVVASLAWEIALEFGGSVSINDTITTTGAGVALGEFAHWFGRYINSGRNEHIVERLLRWTIGLPRTFHNKLDRRIEYRGETDRLGFNADIWHQFRLGYGFAFGEASRHGHDVGIRFHHIQLSARLAAIPGYLRPGSMNRFFADGNVTSVDVNASVTSDGIGVDLIADTMLLGLHTQKIPMPEQGGVGTALTIGANIAYHYRNEKFFNWRDRLGLVHLPGLAIDAHVLGSEFALRASTRLHVDFAGINARSYPEWAEANPNVIDKAILHKRGYYYGWGVSGRAAVELSGPHFDMGASVFYGTYDSQEGLDRAQTTVEVDVNAEDRVLDYSAWVRVGPLFKGWYLGARLSRQDRRGTVADVPSDTQLDRVMLQLLLRL